MIFKRLLFLLIVLITGCFGVFIQLGLFLYNGNETAFGDFVEKMEKKILL